MPNLVVSAVTKYDGKGLAKGKKDISNFDKSIKKLGKTLIGLYSVSKLAQFGKASVKAFLADDKAAAALGKTLENTGNAFAKIDVERFIKSLQKQTGVLDDELRPAFQTLLVATGSVTAAQKGLNTALDVAAGTGSDVQSVTKAIAKAYAGNTTALTKMVPGINKAVLASKDLNAINEELARLFGGQAATAAGTYAGQMKILAASAADAQEVIGGGLMRAIAELGGSNGMGKASQGISDFAGVAAIELQGLAIGIKKIFKSIGDNPIFKLIDKKLGLAKAISQDIAISRQMNIAAPPVLEYGAKREAKIAKDKAIADKKALDLAKKSNALTKKAATDSLALKKANSIFDLSQIQIAAALKGKIDEETRLRLKLQQAILNEDIDKIAYYEKELGVATSKTQELARTLATLPKADDPFADWPSIIAKINSLLKDLKIPGSATALLGLQGLTYNADTGTVTKTPTMATQIVVPTVVPTTPTKPIPVVLTEPTVPSNVIPISPSTVTPTPLFTGSERDFMDTITAIEQASAAMVEYQNFRAGERGDIYVTVNTSVVGNEQALADAIQTTLQNLNRYGTSINYAGNIAI